MFNSRISIFHLEVHDEILAEIPLRDAIQSDYAISEQIEDEFDGQNEGAHLGAVTMVTSEMHSPSEYDTVAHYTSTSASSSSSSDNDSQTGVRHQDTIITTGVAKGSVINTGVGQKESLINTGVGQKESVMSEGVRYQEAGNTGIGQSKSAIRTVGASSSSSSSEEEVDQTGVSENITGIGQPASIIRTVGASSSTSSSSEVDEKLLTV